MRRLSVLVAYLPPGSAVWAADHGLPFGWGLTDLLLTDVYHAVSGSPHPARPKPRRSSERKDGRSLIERLRAQRERLSRS